MSLRVFKNPDGEDVTLDTAKVFRHAHLVPTDPTQNLLFRRGILRELCRSQSLGQHMRELCAQDPLFWINAFSWTYDPRALQRAQPPSQPFITWPLQESLLLETLAAVGFLTPDYGIPPHDIVIEKSRDMGATWTVLLAFTWAWLFSDRLSFLLVSRKEDYVDAGDNPQTLFWKIRHAIKHLPGCMLPDYSDVTMRLHNTWTGSTITGDTTTGDLGAGDRRTAVMLDEFARFGAVRPQSDYDAWRATADTTPCRIAISTHHGTGTKHYELTRDGTTRCFKMHWTLDPRKVAGLYRYLDGKIIWLDKDWRTAHPQYQPTMEDTRADGDLRGVRSFWYDQEYIRRGRDRMDMAENVDCCCLGAGSTFFEPQMIGNLVLNCARDPFETCTIQHLVGDLRIDEKTLDGAAIWCLTDPAGRPPQHTSYALGCDLSVGTGASDSVVKVADKTTGETVLRYINNRLTVESMAKVVVAIARWFSTPVSECYVAWEASGPGEIFGRLVIDELHYHYVYYHRTTDEMRRFRRGRPGYYQSKTNKYDLLVAYRQALSAGQYVNRSEAGLRQCMEYVHTETSVEHMRARAAQDPSGNREGHGDEVIADAICCLALRDTIKPQPKPAEIPVGSLAWRMKQARDQAEDDRSRQKPRRFRLQPSPFL